MTDTRRKRAAAAILFSMIMALVFGFVGFLGGSYLWTRYVPPGDDADDIHAYFGGLVISGVLAIGGGATSLWMGWPRRAAKRDELRNSVGTV